jgi:methylglutaconyl-CoA hydratase
VAVKQLIADVAGRRIDERLIEDTSRRIAEIRATPEAQEGLSAFLEKRKPAWMAPPAKPGSRAKKRSKAR